MGGSQGRAAKGSVVTDGTVARVARPRGELTPQQERRLARAAEKAAAAQDYYRAEVVKALSEGASFVEVAKFTGLSTNTLQRWKREAR
jgi:DNA-directed RNA polymerase specialized sigma24 family protein